jgi:RNA-directed DNA polymerase
MNRTRVDKRNHQVTDQLMEWVVSRTNMERAYTRVVGNKGSAGIDDMTVEERKPYLQREWAGIKEKLLTAAYYPQGVRSVAIPKGNGGIRELGIPTVVDRLVQQALYQVLSSIYEPTFTEYSYGFRHGRSAHQAVKQSRDYIRQGKRWVVDVDLSKFFDEVHHDRLLSRLRKRIEDRRVIHLIDRYLRSGIMRQGIEVRAHLKEVRYRLCYPISY